MADEIRTVSSVSDYEVVKIYASIEAYFEDGFNCHKCTAVKRRHADKLFNKQKSKGCFDFNTTSFLIGDPNKELTVKFKGCVGNYTSISVNYFFDLFLNYEKNVLPFKGTLGEQPAKIIEVFQLIERRVSFKREQKLEKGSK